VCVCVLLLNADFCLGIVYFAITMPHNPPFTQLLVLRTMEYACFNYGAQKPKPPHPPKNATPTDEQ